MTINILTIFPELFRPVAATSIIGRAQGKKLVKINIHNLRDWTVDKHKSVDDQPFGGGAGMVMRVDVIGRALTDLKGYKILLTPQGKTFNQKLALKLAKKKNLVLICGHYEGFDERIRSLVDEEISIGDFILTGGEIPAMAVVDAVTRLIPGVIDPESLVEESFSHGLLEYQQYTRPEKYKNMSAPKILLSGDHEKITEWRKKEAEKRTKSRRPDLLVQ